MVFQQTIVQEMHKTGDSAQDYRNARRALNEAKRLGDEFAAAGYDVGVEDIYNFLEQARPDLIDRRERDAHLLGDSRVAGTYADPYAIAQQRRALSELQRMGSGQMTRGDRSALYAMRQQQDAQTGAQLGAIDRQMQARGLGGAANVGAQLNTLQGSMNANAMQNAMLDQERSRRSLAALQAAGQLGSGMRGQSFQEGTTRGQAADLFNLNNMDWRRRVLGINTDLTNDYNRWRSEAGINQLNNQFGQRADAARIGINANLGAGQALGTVAKQYDDTIGERGRMFMNEANEWSSRLMSMGGGM